MRMLKKVQLCVRDWKERYKISRYKAFEIKKAKDPRRVKLSESVVLSPTQKKEIDDFFVENYGRKVQYYWHRNYTAHSGSFDKEYFPEYLYIPEFERYMNWHCEYATVYADKNVLPHLAKSIGVKTPEVVLSIVEKAFIDPMNNGLTREEALESIRNCGEVFIKPTVNSSSGRGCFIANIVDGTDTITGNSTEQILAQVGDNCVMQKVVKNHASIAKIYAGSVNTFRVITYRWKDKFLHMPVIMRIGRNGSYLDNAHAGGMFIAVDDDGTLHEEAMTEFNQKFKIHPNTQIVFSEQKIDLLPAVIEAAKKMHLATPQLGVVNWDFTIDAEGNPVLIEGNTKGGSIWLIQMAHGKSGFEDKTAEVLQWLKKMRRIKAADWHKHTFGN